MGEGEKEGEEEGNALGGVLIRATSSRKATT